MEDDTAVFGDDSLGKKSSVVLLLSSNRCFAIRLQPREVRRLKYFDPFSPQVGRWPIGSQSTTSLYSQPCIGGGKELLEVRNIGIVGENGGYASVAMG